MAEHVPFGRVHPVPDGLVARRSLFIPVLIRDHLARVRFSTRDWTMIPYKIACMVPGQYRLSMMIVTLVLL